MIGKVVGARHSVELDKDIIIDSLEVFQFRRASCHTLLADYTTISKPKFLV